MTRSPSELADLADRLGSAGAPWRRLRSSGLTGVSHGPGATDPAAYAHAGLSWWLESLSPSFGDQREMLDRVRAGPPGYG
jgi:hypothetical protein